MKEPKTNLYTISGGARRIRVDRRTVQRWVRDGLLTPTQRPGRVGRLVSLGDLQAAYRHQIAARKTRPRGESGEYLPWDLPAST